MKLAIGITLAVLIVLLAWLLFEPSGLRHELAPVAFNAEQAAADQHSASSVAGPQPPVGARRVEREPAAPAIKSAAASAEHTLNVRSSIGLELPFIEWQATERDWQRAELHDDRCEVGQMILPCLVRAPGHVAALASTAGEEIVLEPDALLVLQASNLRGCVQWIRPDDLNSFGDQGWQAKDLRPELRRAISWGWLSDDRLALAVSSDLAPAAVHDEPVEAVVRWRDGRRADFYFKAKAGTRGTWSVPCEDLGASAPLGVQVVRPDGGERGPVLLKLRRIVDGGSSDAHSETHEWGNVVFYSREYFTQDVSVPADANGAQFDSVPTGARFSLSARDKTTSAYGRLVFVHDGVPRTLDLRPAFELTGRLVSSTTALPIATMDWWWQFRDGDEGVLDWHADARGMALPADGRFRLRGPANPPVSEDAPLDPPRHVLLHIEAPSFGSFEQRFDTGGATSFDCGEIRLVPRHSELALAPGQGLTQKALTWAELRISAAPDVWWTVRDTIPQPDGGLELFLMRSEKQPTLLDVSPGDPRPWPDSPSERILLHVFLGDRDPAWAFERVADGRYMAVPRREAELQLDCRAMPSEGKSWYVGWQWHGLWDSFTQVPAYELGRMVSVQYSIPAEGATLYWSASGDPPHAGNEPGGTAPSGAVTGMLVLQ